MSLHPVEAWLHPAFLDRDGIINQSPGRRVRDLLGRFPFSAGRDRGDSSVKSGRFLRRCRYQPAPSCERITDRNRFKEFASTQCPRISRVPAQRLMRFILKQILPHHLFSKQYWKFSILEIPEKEA
jgi:hypothetical protein